MGLENDIPDTPSATQTTIKLADALRIISILNAKVPTDHDGGNLLVLAE